MKLCVVIIILLIFCINKAYADSYGVETGLKIPRYVSLKSDDSNLRVGPSKNYPIIIKYVVNNFPLKIIDEYGDWRKIVDFDNNLGWVHKSLIKGERYGILNSLNSNSVKIFNVNNGKIIGEINTGIIVHIPKCKINWCLISIDNHKGWTKKNYIWGVNKNEEFNISLLQTFIDYYFKSINFLEDYINKI